MKIIAARRGSERGFTLIDLAGVTLVGTVLIALAFPLWADSMAEVRTRVCAGNLGQVGRAVALYASDHQDALPGNQHSPPSWVQSLAEYANTNSYRCPEALAVERRGFTIALNDFLTPRPYGARHLDFSKRAAIPLPQETLMFAEAEEAFRAYDHFHFADWRENGYAPDAFAEQVDVERHRGSANYLFSDGRVDELTWSSGVKPRVTFHKSRFVDPTGGAGRTEMAQK